MKPPGFNPSCPCSPRWAHAGHALVASSVSPSCSNSMSQVCSQEDFGQAAARQVAANGLVMRVLMSSAALHTQGRHVHVSFLVTLPHLMGEVAQR